MDYFRDKISEEIHPEIPEEDVAGPPLKSRVSSEGSL